MIKFNSNTINDWYFNSSDIIKVYRNGAVCYYKLDSSSPSGQTPCFAVVDDITQYFDTEFEDVFNNADGKWYKLNNLDNYEEYGVYGSGRAITYYDGKLTVDDGYEYQYSGGSWVNVGEVSGSTATLPNVPFVLNYNAKNYDSTTYSIPQTNGQTKEVDAICNYNPSKIVDHSEDGYISVTGDTRLAISGGTTPMYRENTETGCTMTIVSKARTTYNYSILTCRGAGGTSQMNWMWRYPSNGIFLHGSSSYNSVTYQTSTTASPITASIRVTWDGGVKQQINDWTNNGSYSGNFGYGSHEYVNNDGSLFCDYLTTNGEFWYGDFYWVYMSHNTLTDEQIQQVIDYNESNGEAEFPIYYAEMQDPPNNLTFSSMTEAEEYECPWVGMNAAIDGDRYIFSGDSQSGYEWVYNPSRLPVGYTEVEYIASISGQTTPTSTTKNNLAYIDINYYPTENTRTVADMQIIQASMNPRYFGSGRWNGLGYIVSQEWTIGESRVRIYCKFGESSGWIQTNYVPNMERHVYDHNNNGKLLIDDVEIVTLPTTSFTCNVSMVIFCDGTASLNETAFARLYSFKVYESGTLVRDLVPCINPSNVAGVYDIVNDVFYGSANGNSLIAGDPI